jgi:hypothetical protein
MRIIPLTSKSITILITVLILIILYCVAVFLTAHDSALHSMRTSTLSSPESNTIDPTDAERIQDLNSIESAFYTAVYETGIPPATLTEMNIDLIHPLKEYSYIPKTYEGGPTRSYEICTTFASAYIPFYSELGWIMLDDNEYSVDGYQYHRQGYQCFRNNIYKSGIHLNVLLTRDDFSSIPNEVPASELMELAREATQFYAAHTKILGLEIEDPDIENSCVKNYYPASENLFRCSILIKAKAMRTEGATATDTLRFQIEAVLHEQGFRTSFTETNPPHDGSLTHSMQFEGWNQFCHVWIGIYTAPLQWDPFPTYIFSCEAPLTRKIPGSFSLRN